MVLVLLGVALFGAGCAGAPASIGSPALAGGWQGRIDVPGAPLDIGITLSADGTGTIDVPARVTRRRHRAQEPVRRPTAATAPSAAG